MARPTRKVSKAESKIISKYRLGGIKKDAAMEKLGVTNLHTFHTIFHNATMELA